MPFVCKSRRRSKNLFSLKNGLSLFLNLIKLPIGDYKVKHGAIIALMTLRLNSCATGTTILQRMKRRFA